MALDAPLMHNDSESNLLHLSEMVRRLLRQFEEERKKHLNNLRNECRSIQTKPLLITPSPWAHLQ